MIFAKLCLRSIGLRVSAVGAVLLTIFNALPAGAQSYPGQVIKIVVPFTAGGAVDVAARIVAPKLSAAFGQPVIIENKGGAGGVLGATAVAQAAPDGYTLLVGTVSTQGTNSAVYTKTVLRSGARFRAHRAAVEVAAGDGSPSDAARKERHRIHCPGETRAR